MLCQTLRQTFVISTYTYEYDRTENVCIFCNRNLGKHQSANPSPSTSPPPPPRAESCRIPPKPSRRGRLLPWPHPAISVPASAPVCPARRLYGDGPDLMSSISARRWVYSGLPTVAMAHCRWVWRGVVRSLKFTHHGEISTGLINRMWVIVGISAHKPPHNHPHEGLHS